MTSRAHSPMVLHSPVNFHSGDVIDVRSTTIRERLEFLSGDLKKLCEEEVRAEARISAMDEKLDVMMTMLTNLEHNSNGRNCNQQNRLESSQNQFQVSSHNCEQNRDEIQLGYRSGSLDIENCASILPKIETPMFDGTNPYVWIVEVERFFQLGRYIDDAKLDLVFLCLEGDVYRWFRREMHRRRFLDWTEFKCRLLARFGSVKSCSPLESVLTKDSIPKKESIPTIVSEATSASETKLLLELGNKKKEFTAEHVTSQIVELTTSPAAALFCDSQPEVVPKNESLHEIDQQTKSSICENSHEAALTCRTETTQSAQTLSDLDIDVLLVHPQDQSYILHVPPVNDRPLLPTLVIYRQYEHHLFDKRPRRVTSKKKQGVCHMSCTFKYTRRKLQRGYTVEYCRMMRQPHISMVMCKMRLIGTCRELKQFRISDAKFHLKHKWRFKQLNPVLAFGLEQVTAENWYERSVFYKPRMSSMDQNHFNVMLELCGSSLFPRKQWISHKCIQLLTIVVVPSDFSNPAEDKITELQAHGSSHGSSPIILISPSLRSSLFSGKGIYKSIHTCLLLMYVLIWRYGREQKEKSELSTKGLLQTVFQQFIHDQANWECSEAEKRKSRSRTRVTTVRNHLLLKERRVRLLMRHRGRLLQLVTQQKTDMEELLQKQDVQIQRKNKASTCSSITY